MRAPRPLAFAALLLCSCDALENIAQGMARAQAQRDLASFRNTAWLVVLLVASTLLARIAASFIKERAGRIPVIVCACVTALAALAACSSALERPPSAVPYETAYFGAIVVAAWLAADAIAARSTKPWAWRASLLGGALALLGAIVASFSPPVGGPIVDAFAPGDYTGCVRYARGGWVCWGLPTRPSTRRVALEDGPKLVMDSGVCSIGAGRAACADANLDVEGPVSAIARSQRELVVSSGETLWSLDGAGNRERIPEPCYGRRVGPVASLALGDSHGCFLRPDRTVSCWTRGRFDNSSLAELTLDPLVEQRRVSVWIECPVVAKIASHDVHAIAAGDAHSVALLEDGNVLTWGSNKDGQLGRPTTGPTDETPRLVPGARFAEIAAGGSSTCGRSQEGAVSCWGGSPGKPSAPARVSGLPRADRLFYDGRCGCVLSDGALWCWGACTLPLRDEEHLREIAGETSRGFATPRRIVL